MKVLIDTNVLLDVLTERRPFYEDSARVWSLVHESLMDGYLSAISVNNLYYIVRKLRDRKIAGSFVDDILRDFKVVSLTHNILKQARTIEAKDFEDCIQYFSAIQEGCEVLVTRNKRDFPSIGLRIMTPTELCNSLKR